MSSFVQRKNIVVVILALLFVLVIGQGAVSAQTAVQAPGLTCPANHTSVATMTWYPGYVSPASLYDALVWGYPDLISKSHTVTVPENVTSAVLTGYTVVGHPEAGCLVPADASQYNGLYGDRNLCDPARYGDQPYEHFNIAVDGGQVGYVPDAGDHAYAPIAPVNLGPLSAGNHTVTYSHAGAPNGHPSVGYHIALCVEVAPPPPPPPPTNHCTYTQGFWKNHAEAWPVASLTLGSVGYDQGQLLAILNQPVQGNGLISLAHQLIAAKLNYAQGSFDPAADAAISAADALIGGLIVPPVGGDSLKPNQTSGLTGQLDGFNNGVYGPGHCG